MIRARQTLRPRVLWSVSVLDICRYFYTPDDERALHLLHQRNAHFVLCCCAEYVERSQDRHLANRWEKARQQAGTDQKVAKQPFWGGSNAKGRQWEQHPASADALSVQLGKRRGLVGIVPSTVGAIVFDADSDLAADAARLAELFGHAPLAVVASSQPKRGHIWYRLPPDHCENNRVYFLDGERRGEIRASNGYILLWRPAELLAQLDENVADAPTLTPEQIEQTRKPKNKPAHMGTYPPTARSQHTDEIGRRPCDADWTAESLAAQSEGGRHDTLKSYLAHYRASTTAEQWPVVLEYLRPAFLVAKPGGEYEFEQLAAYYEAKPSAEPSRKRYSSTHRKSRNAAYPNTPTNGEAHQTAIESAQDQDKKLREWLTPCWNTITDTHDAARLIYHFADQLVIAYDPESREATSDIYAITHNGRLSAGAERLQEMLNEVSDRYLVEINNAAGIGQNEFGACCKAARALQTAGSLKRLAAVMPGTVATLRSKGMLPPALVVKHPAEIDTDLTVLGCKNGVIDLRTGKLLPPSKARDRFVSASTGVDYIPDAQHPAVDETMPERPQNDAQWWWYQYRGWALTHRPRRDMCGMITPPKCGKTVLANADLAALGDYCDTIRSEALQRPGRFAQGGTAHNGDLLKFGRPRRLLYAPDCLGNLYMRLLNQLSGGDRLQVRDVGEKVRGVEVTAHLVIQGNPPDKGRHFLGLDEQSAEADAFRDRLRLYPLQEIPPDRQCPEYVDLPREDALFREAWLARTVQQCQLMIDENAPPEGCETMAQAVRELAALEAPAWRSEWLPRALERDREGTVNSLEIYADYEAWHESEGDGKPQSVRVILDAIREFYACGSGRKGVKMPTNAEGKRRKAIVWDGWKLAAPG